MKKLVVAMLAVVIALGASAVAYAVNEYSITSSLSPTKSGTSSKPVPIGGTFGFNVRDAEARRPLALDALTVAFTGIRLNTRQFPTCSVAAMEQAQSDSVCKSSAKVAAGFANNIAGPAADRNNVNQAKCYLSVNMWNSGSGKAALFVSGKPSPNGPNDPKHCPIAVSAPIPVSVIRAASGDSIRFTIPNSLKFPAPGVRNALIETKLTLARRTVTKSGRKVGYFESVGGCRSGRRTITATFRNEGGNNAKQSGFARCSS